MGRGAAPVRAGWRRPARGATLGCAAALSCLASLLLVPGALASSGEIAGKVTAAASGEGLAQIEVLAFEAGGAELPVGFTITEASGKYTVHGLTGGSYKVLFTPEYGANINYVAQFYEASASFAAATPVTVPEGGVREGVDVELQVGGTIAGTVSEAAEGGSFVPLAHVTVTVYEVGGEALPAASATTAADGAYKVVGLASGSYKVGFAPEPGSGLNYAPQFYDGASSAAGARALAVVQGEETSGIDARLQPGGAIEGTVTGAYTHAPLAGVAVTAVAADGTTAGVALTAASGRYAISGLAAGSYKVAFGGSRYIFQYYDDAPSFAAATPVAVRARATTGGIDAALIPTAPVATAPPVASGTPAAGQTVSCTTGSWTGSPTPVYAYAWLRDGVAIAGATAARYVVQAADVGNGLTCKVTATNRNGSAAAVSNTLIVPVPVPMSRLAPPKPVVVLAGVDIAVSGGVAHVRIACVHAACAGTIRLVERVRVVLGARGVRMALWVTLSLGGGSYSLAAGHRGTIAVRLTPTGVRALARTKHHRLATVRGGPSVTALVSVTGGSSVRAAVTLSETPAKRSGKPVKR